MLTTNPVIYACQAGKLYTHKAGKSDHNTALRNSFCSRLLLYGIACCVAHVSTNALRSQMHLQILSGNIFKKALNCEENIAAG